MTPTKPVYLTGMTHIAREVDRPGSKVNKNVAPSLRLLISRPLEV
jgi:hypothetical protein